jgi:outer membrane scaffolding protein for murein synthesis (MipA/OmpV family)
MLSDNWMLQGQIGIGELVGDAADSPIVQDTTQTSAGIFVAYSF